MYSERRNSWRSKTRLYEYGRTCFEDDELHRSSLAFQCTQWSKSSVTSLVGLTLRSSYSRTTTICQAASNIPINRILNTSKREDVYENILMTYRSVHPISKTCKVKAPPSTKCCAHSPLSTLAQPKSPASPSCPNVDNTA